MGQYSVKRGRALVVDQRTDYDRHDRAAPSVGVLLSWFKKDRIDDGSSLPDPVGGGGTSGRHKLGKRPAPSDPDDSAGPDKTTLFSGDDRLDDKKVRILLSTMAELISPADVNELLRSIVDKAIRLVGAERGILFLFVENDPKKLKIQVARDDQGHNLRSPIPYSTTVTRQVASEGEPRSWQFSANEQPTDLSQSVVDMKLRQVMCAPLRVKEKKLGVIYVDSKATAREYTRGDLKFFDALAGALSIAVENARLIRARMEAERVKAQIRIARTIQEGLLPRSPSDIPGFDIAGWSLPADEALGDYYDFVPMEDGRLLIAIGDVAGHGIGPALLMSSARSLLRSLADSDFPLDRILERMNDRFHQDTRGEIFMSLFIATLDPKSRTLVFGNAGHNAPMLIRKGDPRGHDLKQTGPALGIEEGVEYALLGPIQLEPGDVLALTTDGALEARSGDEFFGRERLEASLRRHADLPARALIDAIHADVRSFAGETPPSDDLTLVVLKAR